MKNVALILAGGKSIRMNNKIPKQFLNFSGKTVIEHSIEIFEENKYIDDIYIVINKMYINKLKELIKKNSYRKIKKIVEGGRTRQLSSYIGLNSIKIENIDDNEINVLIHDAARPLTRQETINRCIKMLNKHKAITVAVPVTDTVVEIINKEKDSLNDNDTSNFNVNNNNLSDYKYNKKNRSNNDKNKKSNSDFIIKNIPDRKYLYKNQTPQCFRLSLIKKAHDLALMEENINLTDDCSLILKYNLSEIYIVKGEVSNIKITYPSDLILAEYYYKHFNQNNFNN